MESLAKLAIIACTNRISSLLQRPQDMKERAIGHKGTRFVKDAPVLGRGIVENTDCRVVKGAGGDAPDAVAPAWCPVLGDKDDVAGAPFRYPLSSCVELPALLVVVAVWRYSTGQTCAGRME